MPCQSVALKLLVLMLVAEMRLYSLIKQTFSVVLILLVSVLQVKQSGLKTVMGKHIHALVKALVFRNPA